MSFLNGVGMKSFSGSKILLSIVVVLGLVGAGAVFLMVLPPEKPADLESATGLSTAELVVVASTECQKYKAILSSSAAGTDYQNWVDGMSDVLTPEEASSFKRRNNAVYDFAKLDISDKLQGRGAFTLQTLIFDGSELNGLQSGKWNMTRLKDFYPITFSTLAGNMANLSLEECGLTELSSGMQQLGQQAKRVVALGNSSLKQTSPSANESLAQENARLTAQSYLRSSSFSRSGLISQLEFEGFSNADATYGVDSFRTNWNSQAAERAAAYLRSSSFSREGLKKQLMFEGFSSSQAEYGLTAVGY
jgi:hypothetical protein